MTTTHDHQDVALAASLAQGAGEVLLALRAAGTATGPAGDRAANDYLLSRLAELHPQDAVLSEESLDDPARLTAERVWIIDPLDGSREFAERTPDGGWRDDFAVHVGLWTRGSGLTAGAVALPARGQVHRCDDPLLPAPVRADGKLRVAVSRTRPPALIELLAREIPLELVPMGSAGVKAMAVVTGEVDAYLHAGGQHEWDSAAPVAVAHGIGLHTSRVDGAELEYNSPSPWLPDLLICRREVAGRLLRALERAGGQA